MAQSQFRYHENVNYQYRVGLYDEDEYIAQRDAWIIAVYANKGIVEAWCLTRNQFYTSVFATEIDSLLTTYQCDN